MICGIIGMILKMEDRKMSTNVFNWLIGCKYQSYVPIGLWCFRKDELTYVSPSLFFGHPHSLNFKVFSKG